MIGVQIGVNADQGDPQIPYPKDVQRYFRSRQDSTLIDEVAGRDALVKFPVSSFKGDGSVEMPEFNFEVGKFIELKIDLSKVDSVQYFLGSTINVTEGIRYNGVDFLCFFGSTSTAVTYVSNGIILLKFTHSTRGNIDVYVDNIAIGTMSGFNGVPRLDILGKRGDIYFRFNGTMHSINLNNELFIPNPVWGYGIDANGQAVPLTVSGSVTVDYDAAGSTWNHDKGCVERNPELVVNGDLSDGLNGYINRDGLEFDIFEEVDGRLHLASTSTDVRVAGNNTIELPANMAFEYTFDAEIISGSWLASARSRDDLTGAPINPQPITNGKNKIILNGAEVIRGVSFANLSGIAPEAFFDNLSIKLATPEIIPNNEQGLPSVTLQQDDIQIPPAPRFLNTSDAKVTLFMVGDTDPEYTFWDKSQPWWSDDVRNSIFFTKRGEWDLKHEMNQGYINANCKDPEKYKAWIKIANYKYKAIYYRLTALNPPTPDMRYVGVK